jgi:hypothetical protein
VFEKSLRHKQAQEKVSRLVPWVNGVKGGETNGLGGLKLKDKRLGFDGVAMARPPNQNPKKERLT